jgi:preprotein translocase subunit YajC
MPQFPCVAALSLPIVALQDGGGGAAGDGPNLLIMFGIPLLIFWFVAMWPERKERKRKAAMLENLRKNDRVLTTMGLYATVAAVHESELVLKFDEGPTRVRALKSAIASVIADKPADGGKAEA